MVRKSITQALVALASVFLAAAASAPSAAGPAGAEAGGGRRSPLLPMSDGGAIELPATDDGVPAPDAVLGYPLGSRFTHWDGIQHYLAALAAASPRVKVWEYGQSYEGRPLQLVAVTSPENLARLDQIRAERLRLADPAGLGGGERERLARRLPVVVWLAYGVHGNESSSSEAAMLAAWVLAAGKGEIAEMLKSTIVLIDPLVNPDGRERYVHGFEQRRGELPNPHRLSAEHWEPWPGGRQNHYLIDLNRDWTWATQQESRQRIAAYRTWEPQVYVDFHEMGIDSSYFFPPAAEPVHPKIDRRLVAWLDVFGRANAEAFDREGWVYFKSESYDLFYPGYGDSYPSLRGAVGMTYEMAGGGRGGLAVTGAAGTQLTLADRIARHFTTALTTVKTAAAHGRRLMEDYAAARQKAAAGRGRSYLWSADQQEARTLADLFALHGVRVGQLAQAAEIEARPLGRGSGGAAGPAGRSRSGGSGPEGKEGSADPAGAAESSSSGGSHGSVAPRSFPAGTFVVSTAQPLGSLVQVLMDFQAPMEGGFLERQRRRFEQNREPEFYDITAWALPLAFNLRVWQAEGEPEGVQPLAAPSAGIRGGGELGYLVAPQGLASFRLAATLRRGGVLFRVALAGFSEGETSYPSGTLFIPRHGNPARLPELLAGWLQEDGLTAQALSSSYGIKGLSLGSSQMPAVRPVRLGLLSGEGIDPTSFGFLWSLLDRQIGLAHDRLDLAHLRPADLAQFDVLVLPSGNYADAVSERQREALDSWVQSGGILVAIGGETIKWLQEHKMTAIKPWKAPEADAESEGTAEKALGERSIFTPGAVLATRLASQHPLALGLPSPPPVLVEGSTVELPTGDPKKDVLVAAPEDPVIAGFAWPEARQRLAGSLLVGVEAKGSGSVVLFVADPAFRLFWRATTPLLLNALMYGTSAGLGGRN
jgi:hypothetical protein